jgi:reverse gyrase
MRKQSYKNFTEFYKNIPPKICVNCGSEMIEQYESYMEKCEHCLSKEIE